MNAELPNSDVDMHMRIAPLPIMNESDYKSIFHADLDSRVKIGNNEIVVLYVHKKDL